MFNSNTFWASCPVVLIACYGTTQKKLVTVQLNHGSLICPVIGVHGFQFAIVPESEVMRHGQQD